MSDSNGFNFILNKKSYVSVTLKKSRYYLYFLKCFAYVIFVNKV
jgi:hypothetical protein